MIPYGRQSIDESDVAAVVDVLTTDWLTQGPKVTEFEAALADRVGAAHAVVFSSGTAALHAAVHAAGLGPGDLVATSPLSFVASANAARYVGTDVEFIDIDPSTLNLDTGSVGPGLQGLIAVHYAGLPVDLRSIERPPVVIEDAAHAIGASTPDGPVGNCSHSDMCCFSFHPVKTITTGEGGAVTTNSEPLAIRLRRFRHHGIDTTDASPEEPWAYDIRQLGFNYRLTDLQAALGITQLAKLDAFVERRNELADRYRESLGGLDLIDLPPAAPPGFRHAYHLFPVQVPDRHRVYAHMRDRGIGVQVHYVPTYRFRSYGGPDAARTRYPTTERVYARLLSLPLYPLLTDDEQDDVVRTLLEALRG